MRATAAVSVDGIRRGGFYLVWLKYMPVYRNPPHGAVPLRMFESDRVVLYRMSNCVATVRERGIRASDGNPFAWAWENAPREWAPRSPW